MTSEQPERRTPDAGDDADDRVIRQLVAQIAEEGSPGGIEAQVLSKITRRRRTLLAVRTGMGVAAVVALAALARPYVTMDRPTTPLTNERTGSEAAADTAPLVIADSQLVSLSATAPVVRFPLLKQDQLAILQCLKSLEEEEL